MARSVASLSATPISTAPWKQVGDASPAVAADPDLTIETYSTLDVDVMADLILGDIGGVELAKILRFDALDGINVVYSPLSQMSRIKPYHSNNLMGQEFSRMVADGANGMNVSRYLEGETSRGLSLGGEPPSTNVDIQVAIRADWIPFAASSESREVV